MLHDVHLDPHAAAQPHHRRDRRARAEHAAAEAHALQQRAADKLVYSA